MGLIDSFLSVLPFPVVLAGLLVLLGLLLLLVGGVMSRTRARSHATPVGQAGVLQLSAGFMLGLASGLNFALGLGLDDLIIGLEVFVLIVTWIALPIALARNGSLFSRRNRGFYAGKALSATGGFNSGLASQQSLLVQQQQEFTRQNMQYQQQFTRPPGT